MSENNDFGWALAQMRDGQKVRRRKWSPEEWVQIDGGRIVDEDGALTAFRDQEAILALDWIFAR